MQEKKYKEALSSYVFMSFEDEMKTQGYSVSRQRLISPLISQDGKSRRRAHLTKKTFSRGTEVGVWVCSCEPDKVVQIPPRLGM